MRHCRVPELCAVVLVALMASGCRSMYYSTMEAFGREKRHILTSRIKEVSQEQNKAADEFRDALTRLKVLSGFEGGDLEDTYLKLSSDYDDCSQRADSVHGRIWAMKQVAKDLFDEWEKEIDDIASSDLRAKSENSLRSTRKRFERLEAAADRAASRMEPVLQQLKDYVLYLKHNLNAQAVGSLKAEADKIETDVDELIRDVQASVGEAQMFLKDFEQS